MILKPACKYLVVSPSLAVTIPHVFFVALHAAATFSIAA